jgi:hypothetical protein
MLSIALALRTHDCLHVLCLVIGAGRAEDACTPKAIELVTELVSVTVKHTALHFKAALLCMM